MRNVYAKFERQKIGRSRSKLDAIFTASTSFIWRMITMGPSHKHASRRSNLLKNFRSYISTDICTELLVEGHSVQRNKTAAIPTSSGRLRVYTKRETQVFWVSCTGTKISPLKSLPSIKHIWEATLKLPRSWWLSIESAGRFTSFLASFSANPRLLHVRSTKPWNKSTIIEQNFNLASLLMNTALASSQQLTRQRSTLPQ